MSGENPVTDSALHSGLAGGARFSVGRRLGAGSFGDVYEAVDEVRHVRLALKVLRRLDAKSLLNFKREFRALAELSHPNLVQLYELFMGEETSFFSMERVDGVNVVDYIYGFLQPRCDLPSDSPMLLGSSSEGSLSSGFQVHLPELRPLRPRSRPVRSRPFIEARVRSVLPQLGAALSYLHQQGRLHCDIKPSNVLVTQQGTVKVLDFGLASERGSLSWQRDAGRVGTPHYMAPEQAWDEASPASDWYALGVILYEMLTDRLPFEGSAMEVLSAKQTTDPVAPQSICPAVPDDLNTLCLELLQRDPERRMLQRRFVTEVVRADLRETGSVPFVGRRPQLRVLEEAFEVTEQGGTSVALLQGPSGMGKTALMHHFMERLRRRHPDALILAGRCHLHESVAFKALDEIIDALSRVLLKLPTEEVARVLPPDLDALSRLFPVLRQVEAIGEASKGAEPVDPTELRFRAFKALREVFSRLGEKKVLVLGVDDLQWGDADSAALLIELLRPPHAPRLLLVASCRADEQTTACLQRLLPFLRANPSGIVSKEIEVGPLELAEAAELARAVLAGEGTSVEAESIAREAGGRPLFVHELAHHSNERQTTDETMGVPLFEDRRSLDELIRQRAGRLPELARQFLILASITDQPITPAVVEEIAGQPEDNLSAWHCLSNGHWLRTRQTTGEEVIEPYHDRIREAVAGLVPPEEERRLHGRLALVLEAKGGCAHETLAFHFEAAGVAERTARYATAAAVAAYQGLAFDRAARMYQRALTHTPQDHPQRCQLQSSLGDALAMAGQGQEAAAAYLLAVPGASREETLELRRRAAQQLLTTGRIESGLEIIRSVLAEVGVVYPETKFRAWFQLLWYVLRLRLRGLRFQAGPGSPAHRFLVDSLYVATHTLGPVDPLRGGCFSKRHAFEALRAGDAERASRALANEIPYATGDGKGTQNRRERRIHLQAQLLGEASGHPGALAFVELRAGLAALLRGRLDPGLSHLQQAEVLYQRNSGSFYEISYIHFLRLIVLRFRGEWKAMADYLREPLRKARARGDVFAQTQLLSAAGDVPWLLEDDAEGARREIDEMLVRWGRPELDQQNYQGTLLFCDVLIYQGGAAAHHAHRLLERVTTGLKRSGMWYVGTNRLALHDVWGRAALAVAADIPRHQRAPWLRLAARHGHAARALKRPGGDGVGTGLLAGTELSAGRVDRAIALLDLAQKQASEVSMKLRARAAQWRRGQLIGGETGRLLREDAEGVIAADGVKNPARVLTMYLPGI